MLSQYVEVEQLGQIYVCDKCNGMTNAFFVNLLLVAIYIFCS